MILRTFGEDDAPLLCSWIPDARANFLWGGPAFPYPLQVEAVCEHIAKPEVTPFLLIEDGEPVGYIDLYQVTPEEIRLCRVLVAHPQSRGKGWGKQLVKLALQVAKERKAVKRVSLAVFDQNEAAKACYQSLGFKVLPEETKVRRFGEENWTLLRMMKVF